MGNSCMGVHRIACQIREPITPDKTSLDPSQLHSTRWPMMTEPDISMQATSLQGTYSKQGKHGFPCKGTNDRGYMSFKRQSVLRMFVESIVSLKILVGEMFS